MNTFNTPNSSNHSSENPSNGVANGHAQSHSNNISTTDQSEGLRGLLGRLATVRRGHKVQFHPVGHALDTRARARNRAGEPMSRVHVFLNPALADEKPVAETRLKNVLELIAQTSPATANALWRRYDNVVLFKRTRFLEAQRQSLQEWNARNEETGRHNSSLEARIAEVEAKRDSETAEDRVAVVALDEPLGKAHAEAAHAVARAGSVYDPNHPSPAGLLRHVPTPLRAIAGRDVIPYAPEEDGAHPGKGWGLGLIGSIFTGLVLGPSFGVAVGLLNPKAALRGRISDLIAFGLLLPVGTWFAVKIRDWIKASFYDASERYWLGLPASSWAGMWAQSVGFAFSLLALLCFIEQFGLLKISALMKATGAGGQAVSTVGALALGATSAFFIGAAAWEGIVGGKNSACHSRLLALQHSEFEVLDQRVRSSEPVQMAMEAIALVHDLLRQKATLESRVEAVAAPFNTLLEELEAQKREPEEGLDAATTFRLQDAYDDWFGANAVFEARLERELDLLEGGFWNRLKNLFRFRSHSRRGEARQRS